MERHAEDRDAVTPQEMILVLRQEAARLQEQERFSREERRVLAGWPSPGADLQEALEQLERLGARPEAGYSVRLRALLAALGMLLWDLRLLSPRQRNGLLRPELLSARLRHYYRLSLEQTSTPPPPEEGSSLWRRAARRRRLEEALERWEGEILPTAVCMVCGDAGVAVPSRLWPELAAGRLSRVRRALGLSGRREAFLRRLERILPQAREEFLAHLEDLLEMVEPEQWERLRPRPEDFALVLRGKLWHQGPRPPREERDPQPPDPSLPGEQPAPEADRETPVPPASSPEDRFLEALQALLEHSYRRELARGLDGLRRDLQRREGASLREGLDRLLAHLEASGHLPTLRDRKERTRGQREDESSTPRPQEEAQEAESREAEAEEDRIREEELRDYLRRHLPQEGDPSELDPEDLPPRTRKLQEYLS